MPNLFDTNPLEKNIKIKTVEETTVYIVDDFYKYPDEVFQFILSNPKKRWKDWDTLSYNGIHFLDERHNFYDERLLDVCSKLETLCGEKVVQPGRVVTNCMTFYNKEFNNYKDNFWGPHNDLGYTALIYLNKETCEGTNFYKQVAEDPWDTPEHFDPWRSKDKYQLIDTIESKFNRMVLFNGLKLTHGMSINSDRFFNDLRINQVVFLKP